MRLSRIAMCGALVAGLLVAGGGTASAECEQVWLEVYDVEFQAERRTYHVGDTARVEATVTRQDTGAPVEDARFAVIITNWRKGWMFGFDETDALGRATAQLKLNKNRVELGPVTLRGIGYKQTADAASCAQVVEYGQKRVRKAFTIKP